MFSRHCVLSATTVNMTGQAHVVPANSRLVIFRNIIPKKLFSRASQIEQPGPGSSNKRIRSWLRTIYPYSLGVHGGRQMSFRCGRCCRPRLRGKLRRSVALPVAALPGLTRRPGCQSFWSCGRIGWRACGGEPSAGFLPRGLVAFPVSSGYALGYSPNPALQATGRIKPRPAPELSR